MSVIYESLDESKMTYPGGSVYIEFDRVVTAKHFTAELLDDAAKEWVMSDVTMLG